MSSEDSGVIDLFAIHEKAAARAAEKAAAQQARAVDDRPALPPSKPFSAPPPAFTTNVSFSDDELDPFSRKTSKKPLIFAGLGAIAVLVIGIFAASSATNTPPKATTASLAKTSAAPPVPSPPPVAVIPVMPAPVETAAPTPAPPSTSKPTPSKATAKAPRTVKPRASGPKLQKVQSGGVP